MIRGAGIVLLLALLASGSAGGQPDHPAGASLDLSAFQYRRALSETPAGLVSLQLDAAALAHSRGPFRRFADVRVVDRAGNQVPYLLERGAEPLSLDLTARPAVPRARTLREDPRGRPSFYAIGLPYPGLPEPRLVLETPDRVFRRPLRVGVEREPDRRHREVWFEVLASPLWQHADPEAAAPPLEVPVSPADATALLLIVEEGDNRPLTLASVRLLLPSWRLRFFRPEGPVQLVYGNPSAAVPQYDLALNAQAVLAGDAQEVAAAPEQTPAGAGSPALSPALFWLGLGLAVLVLLGLIVRLVSSAAPPPPSPPAP